MVTTTPILLFASPPDPQDMIEAAVNKTSVNTKRIEAPLANLSEIINCHLPRGPIALAAPAAAREFQKMALDLEACFA